MIIQGCDLSHWNSDSQFKNLLVGGMSFFMLKATEGRTYVDKKFAERSKKVMDAGLGLCAYHYARPEKNSASAEAKNFVDSVKNLGNDCVYALDWEGVAETKGVDWIIDFCGYVEGELGRTPMLYVNHAYAVKANMVLAEYPLWVAKWGPEPTPKIGPWDNYTVWQYSNTPYDKDVFYGSISDFNNIGRIDTSEEMGHYCGCCCCCSKK